MAVCFGLHVIYRLHRGGVHLMQDLLTDLTFLGIFAAFMGLRWWLGHVIAKSAMRRGCGFIWWVYASLLVGPMVVWIVYLIFVHWRPAAQMELS